MADKPENMNLIMLDSGAGQIVRDTWGEIKRKLEDAEKNGEIFVEFQGKSGYPVLLRYRKIDAVMKYKKQIPGPTAQPGPGGSNVINI